MPERYDARTVGELRPEGTLLLVDDEANILSALRRLLRQDGYTLLTAGSGAEGLEVLERQPVDVILSDQRMPGMSGVEFLRQAKAMRPDTIRMVLSGYTELESITNAINEGAIFKFLTKPWDDDQLRAIIAEAFQYKGLADENVRLARELRHANRCLETTLKEQQGQIVRDRIALNVLHEVLQLLPWPLLGVDEAGMIAAANEEADRAFGSRGTLLGCDIRNVLPAEVLRSTAGHPDGTTVFSVDGRQWRVVRRMLGPHSEAHGQLFIFQSEPD